MVVMATIERRPGKRGISYRVEWRHNGDRKRLTYDNEQDAIEWKHLIEATGGDSDKADKEILKRSSTAPTLGEVAEEHFQRLIDITPHTLHKYREVTRHHLHPLDMPVDKVTEDDVIRWVAWMRSEARDGKGYAAKTIKNTHGVLYSVLAYAVKRGYRPDNPATDTRLPAARHEDDRNKFLTYEEFNALLPHVALKYQPYALFLYNTGVRVGELLALTPEDFSIIDGVTWVRINKSAKQAGIGHQTYIGEPKTQRSRRTFDVNDETMQHVWPLIRSAGHGNPVFRAGTTQSSSILGKVMWKPTMDRARAAGFSKEPTLHSLRHSHASRLLELGIPLQDVSDRLGHSSVAVTDRVYRHRMPSRGTVVSKAISASLLPSRPHTDSPAVIES